MDTTGNCRHVHRARCLIYFSSKTRAIDFALLRWDNINYSCDKSTTDTGSEIVDGRTIQVLEELFEDDGAAFAGLALMRQCAEFAEMIASKETLAIAGKAAQGRAYSASFNETPAVERKEPWTGKLFVVREVIVARFDGPLLKEARYLGYCSETNTIRAWGINYKPLRTYHDVTNMWQTNS